MKLQKVDLYISFIIAILSIFFVTDLFLSAGRLASFDIPFHITNMAQFFQAFKSGDFPVVWTGGLANYGLPMSIVAHQLTSYLGAIVIFFSHDPLFAYKIVAFLGIFLSSLFYYFFLRFYFKPFPAFAGIFLFTFSTYKILNFYVRGALPEFFSGIFLPLILIGMYLFIKQRKLIGLLIVSISFFLLSLNHPMMLLIYSAVYFPYLIFLLFFDIDTSLRNLKISKKIVDLVLISLAILIGVGVASYYLIPLNLEIKYFYYGLIKDHLTPNSFLGIGNFLGVSLPYFTNVDIYPRGNIIMPGIIEITSVGIGILLIAYNSFLKHLRRITILEFAIIVSLLCLLFTTVSTKLFYVHISLLNEIQFPWRMLSSFLFIPPIIFASLFTTINKKLLILGFVIIISIIQFPQLYGKNYTFIPKETYYFTPYNPHSVLMNPIWTGLSEDYPIEKNKPAIIDGQGKIVSQKVKNSSRNYVIDAKTPIRMVDYTFYFPGWHVYVDGVQTPIEFQDPNYRGVITYRLNPGQHNVVLKFEDTKVRTFGKLATLASILIIGFLFVFRKKIAKIIY